MPYVYFYDVYGQSTTPSKGGQSLWPLRMWPFRLWPLLNPLGNRSRVIQTAVSAVVSEGAEPTGGIRVVSTGVQALATDL